jgi:hypothetical protein
MGMPAFFYREGARHARRRDWLAEMTTLGREAR